MEAPCVFIVVSSLIATVAMILGRNNTIDFAFPLVSCEFPWWKPCLAMRFVVAFVVLDNFVVV
jgi:hypothetical protein